MASCGEEYLSALLMPSRFLTFGSMFQILLPGMALQMKDEPADLVIKALNSGGVLHLCELWNPNPHAISL